MSVNLINDKSGNPYKLKIGDSEIILCKNGAYNPERMNFFTRILAGIFNWTVDYTYTDAKTNTTRTVVLGSKSLEAFMRRNKILSAGETFHPDKAIKLLSNFLSSKKFEQKI